MIVYTGGTFDCFHAGHVNFLRQCSVLGDVVVSLNTDEFIEEYKGRPPIMKYDERKKVLEACSYVTKVVKNVGGADSKKAILKVKPDIIAIDTGWAVLDYYKQMGFTQKWIDENDMVLVYLPRTQDISTTEIRKRLHEASNCNTDSTK